jgi:PAS domain S-box-containing protein
VVSFNAGTFRDTAGRVAGILAAARDITAQKRLEEQLRDQQNYNRSLIESSVDALMTVDPAGVITDVNEQTVKLFGFNRKQLIGSPFVDYFTDRVRAGDGVRQTFDAGAVTNYELVARAKTGRKIPVSFNAAVFRDTTGQVGGILAAAREITQQKQIEEELREQQTYTRGLIESNIDALMTTDTLGIITDVNRQMCEVTGRTRDELVGTPFKDYFTDPQRAEDGIRRVLAEDRVTNYELTIRATDGRETVVSYNATTFKGAGGRLRGVFAAARDITDQKRLEDQITQRNRELTETTTFLNNVLESSTEYSIIAKDLDGDILTWNEGARRNYGYSAEDMVGGAAGGGAADGQGRGRLRAGAQVGRPVHGLDRGHPAPRHRRHPDRLPPDLQGHHRPEDPGGAASSGARTRSWRSSTGACRRPTGSRASSWPTCRTSCAPRSTRSSASPS